MICQVQESPTNEGTDYWEMGCENFRTKKTPVRMEVCPIGAADTGVRIEFEGGGWAQYPIGAVAVFDDGKKEGELK